LRGQTIKGGADPWGIVAGILLAAYGMVNVVTDIQHHRPAWHIGWHALQILVGVSIITNRARALRNWRARNRRPPSPK
jgi:hypothetical protein